MKLGVAFSATDLGAEPGVLRDFALLAEAIGYHDLMLPDHVLGVNVASRPDWGSRNTSADGFHAPFVAFGFLAGVCTNGSWNASAEVLRLPQSGRLATFTPSTWSGSIRS